MNMKNEKWKSDHTPIDPAGLSFVDSQYTKAYLRHLFISNEILGAMIASQHNLRFYMWLMETAREKILAGEYARWKADMVPRVSTRL
jgi:queuine tRNA-ribosyltransferase